MMFVLGSKADVRVSPALAKIVGAEKLPRYLLCTVQPNIFTSNLV